MKNCYRIISKVIIVILVAILPVVAFSQDTIKKSEAPKSKAIAPSYKYWSVQAFGGIMQFNGDLSKNVFFNLGGTNTLGYNYGVTVTKQFTRVIGLRARIAHGKVQSQVEDKFVDTTFVSQYFRAYPWEADLQLTINWLNWILGCKPERVFSSYLIAGIGLDQTIGHRNDLLLGDVTVATLGQDGSGTNVGNTSGISGHNTAFKVAAGIGFEINIHKNWSINPEFLWRWRAGDKLANGDIMDMQVGGAKQVFNDMYSSGTIGLTYKFGYKGNGCGNCLQNMENNYGLVKYDVSPAVLTEKGDSVIVTIHGTFPEKYFCPKAAMYFEPAITYQGGQYPLKGMNLMGEDVTGDGTMIKYKEGGSFTYTTIFPYKPEMNTSELVVAPTVYEAKEKVILKKEEIKVKGRFIDLPSRDLAPGIIYTPTRILNDQMTIIADHGYQKEVIISKEAKIYFKVNKYNLDLKFGLNKDEASKTALADLAAFLGMNYKLKNIQIDGWASPEGEETFNAGLSDNRAKTAQQFVIDWYKDQVKQANKTNKDKKAVKALVDAAGTDINFVVTAHGPDWDGFLQEVQASNMKDKSKVLNVINSSTTNLKKEQEIRNMILIYPEIEENMLPPLRRAVIKVNAYEPRLTDEQLSQMAVSSPDKLKVEEILYAATLTNNPDTKLTIYDNAATVYPNNWKALNNAGVANIAKGNLDKALNLLNKAATQNPNNGIIENNLGVVFAKMGDAKKADAAFKKAQQLGENTNYNQGILLIPKGDYQKAQTLLANSTCTYNLGLAQLVGGNISAAETTLKCAPQTPETNYLLAIIGARKADTKMLYDYLAKACQNADLKAQAKGDREFYTYEKTPEFQNIVK